MKIDINRIRLVIYILSAILLGGWNIAIPIYIAFFLMCIHDTLKIIKYKKKILFKESALKIILYSCILPNNEIIIVISFICMLIYIIEFLCCTQKQKISIGLLLIIVYIFINSVINDVNIKNAILFVVFNFTMIFYYFFFKNISNSEIVSSIIKYITEISIIQLVATLSILIFNFNEVIQYNDLDWSTGTFGIFQQNILMNVCVFILIILLKEYYYSKNKKYIKYIILVSILAMSTGTIANSIILFFVVVLMFIFSIKIKIKTKIQTLTMILFIIISFITFNPSWVIKDIVNLSDKNYIEERIEKIQTYRDVFVEIPKKDKKFLLFGNGLGQFSSRAALTATGKYIDFYAKIAKPNISEYTYKYVYPKMLIFTEKGVMSAPYSSVISIQSELGLIVLVMFFIFMLRLLFKKDIFSKISILYFIGILFIDNYVEYAKVVVFFWMSYFYRSKFNKDYK